MLVVDVGWAQCYDDPLNALSGALLLAQNPIKENPECSVLLGDV